MRKSFYFKNSDEVRHKPGWSSSLFSHICKEPVFSQRVSNINDEKTFSRSLQLSAIALKYRLKFDCSLAFHKHHSLKPWKHGQLAGGCHLSMIFRVIVNARAL